MSTAIYIQKPLFQPILVSKIEHVTYAFCITSTCVINSSNQNSCVIKMDCEEIGKEWMSDEKLQFYKQAVCKCRPSRGR